LTRRAWLWLLGLAALALFAVLAALDSRLQDAGGPGIIGFELAGSADRAREIVAGWGEQGRRAARQSLLLDYPYLVAYGAFLALAAAAIRDSARVRGRRRLAAAGGVIVWFPIAAAACDAIENLGLLLALGGRGGDVAAPLATAFAAAKFLLTTVAIVYILVGLGARIRGGPAAAVLILAGVLLTGCGSSPAPTRTVARAEPVTRPFPPADQDAFAAIVRREMAAQGLPGAIVGAWVPGRGGYRRAFGRADLRTNAPIGAADHVRIAGITQTFTATAALQLVDEGRLSLEDRLSKYVPGIPNGNAITLRQLLGMTAGVYDYTADPEFARRLQANPLMAFGPRDALAIIRRHRPSSPPGQRVQFSDSNYVLAGLVVEKVARQPVGAVIQQRILRPLALRGTSYPTTLAIPAPFPRGYLAGADGKVAPVDVTALNPNVLGAAGAMISTLDDLRVWAHALATGTLLEPGTQAQRLRLTPIPNPGGPSTGYGLGILGFAGFLGHTGAIRGYNTAMLYLPSARATIVVAVNRSSDASQGALLIATGIARHLFPRQFDAGAGAAPNRNPE
jgi:D-alanyl-D-alanine carboxypeptidase